MNLSATACRSTQPYSLYTQIGAAARTCFTKIFTRSNLWMNFHCWLQWYNWWLSGNICFGTLFWSIFNLLPDISFKLETTVNPSQVAWFYWTPPSTCAPEEPFKLIEHFTETYAWVFFCRNLSRIPTCSIKINFQNTIAYFSFDTIPVFSIWCTYCNCFFISLRKV